MSMTTMNPAARWPSYIPGSGWIDALARRQPAMTAAGLLLLLSIVPLALAAILDDRTLHGVSVWSKPLKFDVSLALYTLTLAFFAGWIDERARTGRLMRYAMTAAVAAIAFEQVWIVVQASQGLESHFNDTAPFYAWMYAAMGVGALILTFAAPVVGWQIWKHPIDGLTPALRTGAALGLVLTFPLTVVTAGFMGSADSHWIGGAASDADGLFLMGWAREGGDLRVPHFFATHAMHAIPLAAALSALVLGRDRRWPVFIAAAAYVGFVAIVFGQALNGEPFLPFLG